MEQVGGPEHGKIIEVQIERGSDDQAVWTNLPMEYAALMKQHSDEE